MKNLYFLLSHDKVCGYLTIFVFSGEFMRWVAHCFWLLDVIYGSGEWYGKQGLELCDHVFVYNADIDLKVLMLICFG